MVKELDCDFQSDAHPGRLIPFLSGSTLVLRPVIPVGALENPSLAWTLCLNTGSSLSESEFFLVFGLERMNPTQATPKLVAFIRQGRH